LIKNSKHLQVPFSPTASILEISGDSDSEPSQANKLNGPGVGLSDVSVQAVGLLNVNLELLKQLVQPISRGASPAGGDTIEYSIQVQPAIVGDGVGVIVNVGEDVLVGVGCGVAPKLLVGVGVWVFVAVNVGVFVTVGVGVDVDSGVLVGVVVVVGVVVDVGVGVKVVDKLEQYVPHPDETSTTIPVEDPLTTDQTGANLLQTSTRVVIFTTTEMAAPVLQSKYV
jgi:hypothetical protein